MSLQTPILLLGTNLGEKEFNLRLARELIEKDIGVIVKIGDILETEPVGFTSTSLFLNQLIQVKTPLSPMKLLKSIKQIESHMGRTYPTPLPNEQYVSRIIDIDIMEITKLNYISKTLKIPHNQIYTRKFAKGMLSAFKVKPF